MRRHLSGKLQKLRATTSPKNDPSLYEALSAPLLPQPLSVDRRSQNSRSEPNPKAQGAACWVRYAKTSIPTMRSLEAQNSEEKKDLPQHHTKAEFLSPFLE